MQSLNVLRRSVAFTLFAVSFVTFAYFYQGGGQNESARFDSIRALLDYDSLAIDPFTYNSADIIFLNGHAYSGKAPGTFFLGLAPFAATSGFLRIIGVSEPIRYHWVCYVTTLFGVSLFGALSTVLLYWLGLRLGAPRKDSAIVALTLTMATIYFPFSTVFFSHVPAALCLLLGFYLFFSYRQEVEKILTAIDSERPAVEKERWRLWLGGAALGFSVTLEYPSAIGALLIGFYVLPIFIRRRSLARHFPALILGGLCGVLPLLTYNWIAFRNPFYITYEAYAHSANTTFEAHKHGVLGIRIPLWDLDAWPQWWSNFKEITYKPLRGIFFANPVLILAPAGFSLLLRKSFRRRYQIRDEAMLSLAIFAAYLAFNAGFGDSITYWGGGASFGPRYLIAMLPFLAIPLLLSLDCRWSRPAFVPLALLSLFICLMATAVEPRAPYSPNNPVFYFYLPRFFTGNLAINQIGTFSGVPMTADSIAFNIGKLVGLPAQLQLLPLYLFWTWCARRIDAQLQIPNRGFFYAVGIIAFIAAWLPIASLLT